MKNRIALMASLLAIGSTAALAGDGAPGWLDGWTVGIGGAQIHKRLTMEDLQGPFTPPGLKLGVDTSSTLMLSLSRRLNDGLELQLVGGWPPTEKITGSGPATVGSVPFNGVEITRLKQLAPTLLLNFAPKTQGAFEPYFGVGINYTHFYDIKSTAAGDAVSGGPTVTTLDDSWGAAAQLGLRYRFMDHWKFDVSVLKADVSSKLTAKTSGVTREARMDFDPTVGVMAIDYSF